MRERQAKLLADDFTFLEAPKWRDGKIWVSDVHDKRVYAITPDGQREEICQIPGMPAGLGFMPDGRLIIASVLERKLMQWKDGKLSLYADLTGTIPYPINDFVIDAKGRIYIGNHGYDYFAGESQKPTNMHRVDPDGSVTEVATDLHFPNAAVIINDGRTLVVNETWVGHVTAFDIAEDGTLGNRRIFADLTGRGPDGMCADAAGAVWIGCYNSGEILRVLDGGEITDCFKFDGCGISCDLGGEDNHTLFLTAFIGPEEEVLQFTRRSAILTAKVNVGAPFSQCTVDGTATGKEHVP